MDVAKYTKKAIYHQCEGVLLGGPVCLEVRSFYCPTGLVLRGEYAYMCEEHMLEGLVRRERART